MIGLVPYVGDLISMAISGLLVLAMVRHGAGGRVLLLMLGNILLDALVGSIPVLGDLFDIFYKANRRNFELLRAYHNEGRHQGSGCGIMLLAVLLLTAVFAFAIWSIVKIGAWIVS